jgi:N-acetylneuraminic acid mutarotase
MRIRAFKTAMTAARSIVGVSKVGALAVLAFAGCTPNVELAQEPPDAAAPDSAHGLSQDAGSGSCASSGTCVDSSAPSDDSGSAPDTATPTGPGVLLFAGYGEAPLDDTWSWNGSTWIEENLAAPPSRDDQAMVGFGTGQVFLFGGESLGSYLGDTWQWSAGAWTQLSASGPSAREGAGVAVLNGKVILYGGESSAGGFLTDTWEWDGKSWTQLSVSGATPGQRYGHSMVTLGDVIVLFGNVGGPTDTWTFDGTTWTQAATVGPTGDPDGLFEARGFQTMAALNGKLYLFGGEQDANHILNDTWSWDGVSWTQLDFSTPPPPRFHAGMTTFRNEIVLFGGAGDIPSGPPFLGDTWTFDGNTWTQVATTGPSARYAYAVAVH